MTLAIDNNLNSQLENYSISSKTAIITGLIGSINRGIMQLNIIIITTISSRLILLFYLSQVLKLF